MEWSARRQRFGLPLIHEVQEKHRFHWFSWIRFWQFKSIDEQLGWWSAFLFWWGGLMFAISGISGSIRSVSLSLLLSLPRPSGKGTLVKVPPLTALLPCLQVLATQKNGRWTTYAWLDGYTSIAGAEISPTGQFVPLESHLQLLLSFGSSCRVLEAVYLLITGCAAQVRTYSSCPA